MKFDAVKTVETVEKMVECHETIRRLFPDDYSERLDEYVDIICRVMREKCLNATEAGLLMAKSVADRTVSHDKDVALLWIWAGVVEVLGREIINA